LKYAVPGPEGETMPAPKSPAPPEPEGPDDPSETAQLVDRIEEELGLLARNVDILEKLAKSPPIGIIRLSEALHLPIHKTRYSLHLLEREGVIQPSADGAVVTEKARAFWIELNASLDRMQALIQHLKQRAAEHEPKSPPGRKGY
jgi:predicted transcriptional regulator